MNYQATVQPRFSDFRLTGEMEWLAEAPPPTQGRRQTHPWGGCRAPCSRTREVEDCRPVGSC